MFNAPVTVARRHWLRSPWPLPRLAVSVSRAPAQAPPVLEPLPMPEILKQYQPISAERSEESARRRLADDPPHVRRLGIQPAQPDRYRTTSARLQPAWVFSTGVDQRTRGAADRRQRRDVRVDAGQPGDRHQREDRHAAVAVSPAAADARRAAASDQPRRRRLQRQGVLRRR